jgi:hypothetical protein
VPSVPVAIAAMLLLGGFLALPFSHFLTATILTCAESPLQAFGKSGSNDLHASGSTP